MQTDKKTSGDKKACNQFIQDVKAKIKELKPKVTGLCRECEGFNTLGQAANTAWDLTKGLSGATTQLVSDLILNKKEKNALDQNMKDPTCKEQCAEVASRGEKALILCMCGTSGCGYGLEDQCKELAGGDSGEEDSCEVRLSFLKNDPGLRAGGDYNELLGKCKCEEAGMYWNTSTKTCEAEKKQDTQKETTSLAYNKEQLPETLPENEDENGDKASGGEASVAPGMAGGSSTQGNGLKGLGNLKKTEKDKKNKPKMGALTDPRNTGFGRDYNKPSSGMSGTLLMDDTNDGKKKKDIAAANGKNIFDLIHEVYESGIKGNKFMYASVKKSKGRYSRKPQSIKHGKKTKAAKRSRRR
ncbi:MAG: hypothetical protein JXA66_06370 [Oligoflexia bacterium]|nr:hypothetical protein [Oligoflexia bacterium]